jgi:hypothetical protein
MIHINESDKCSCGAYWCGNGYCCNGHPRGGMCRNRYERVAEELLRFLDEWNKDPYSREPLRFVRPQKSSCIVMEDVLEDTVQAIRNIIEETG